MPAVMLTAADQLDTIRELAQELYGNRAETVDRGGFGYYRVDDYEYGAEFVARPLDSLDTIRATELRHELSHHVAEYADDPEADPDRIEDQGQTVRL
ncbi:hypothetical protein CIB93_36475 [Streptomyces sp. WZ.A104]|uniref:hypothetical protein n=1 Tax=unclassified Streptomyces TaxID=2593676 RepID=UPI0009337CF1|nr:MULTISPECIES: hypothetical protein [unclassified Streptomyces]PCG81235.1 hypothetical protein CIB93_36475 [Streptomyces sp. WZ.A104]